MHYTIATLDDYLRGELPADRDVQVHAHLETCAVCSALHEEAATLRDWIVTAAAHEEREFPSMIKAQVWEAVRNAQPSPLERLRAFWRPALAVPVAAVIALAAYLSVPIVRPGAAPVGVAAIYLLEEHAAETSSNPLADRGLIVPASLPAERSAPSLIDAADAATLSDTGGSASF